MGFGFDFASEKSQASSYVFLQKVHIISWAFWLIAAIFVVCFSCLWSDISAKSALFTNPADQWQACFTASQQVVIPLDPKLIPVYQGVDDVIGNVGVVLLGANLTTSCSASLAQSLVDVSNVRHFANPSIGIGQILNSLSFIGIQSIIYSAIGMGALNFAFNNPTWLPVSISLLLWNVFAVLTFYTVNPVLPVPNQINSTLLTLLQLISTKEKFTDLNNGDNQCDKAFNYMSASIFFIVVIFFIIFVNFVVAILAEIFKLRDPNKPHYEPLQHTTFPVVIALFAAFFYFLLTVGKSYGSTIALNSIGNFNIPLQDAGQYNIWYPTIWFPFTQPGLDLGTLLYISSFMLIVRGYSVQSLSSFLIAAPLALVYSLAAYPPAVGSFEFLRLNNFGDWNSCWQYFYSGPLKPFFGYPDELQSKHFCTAFRLTSTAYLLMFICMHILPIACFLCLRQNDGRKSMTVESFDAALFAANDSQSKSLSQSNKMTLKEPLIDQ